MCEEVGSRSESLEYFRRERQRLHCFGHCGGELIEGGELRGEILISTHESGEDHRDAGSMQYVDSASSRFHRQNDPFALEISELDIYTTRFLMTAANCLARKFSILVDD